VALGDHDLNGGVDPMSADLGDLRSLVSENEIHRVIVAPEISDSEEILETIRSVKNLGVSVSVLPRLFEVVESSVDLDNVDGLTLLGVSQFVQQILTGVILLAAVGSDRLIYVRRQRRLSNRLASAAA
jgi:hypothetical protein